MRVPLLQTLARACALCAGALLTAVTAVVCASLLGRNTTGWTLVGDFELSAAAVGAAIALFLPWCQLQGAHVRVEFFTLHARPAVRAALDRLGAALTAAMLGLLAWRAAVGGLNAWRAQAGSMILGLPEWWVYALMVPPLVLASVIAAAQALAHDAAASARD